jgi:hypothetical protein
VPDTERPPPPDALDGAAQQALAGTEAEVLEPATASERTPPG